MNLQVGIDLGGTKTEIAALQGESLVARFREDTAKNYEGSLQQIQNLIEKIQKEIGHPIRRVGIGTPGAISKKTGLIKNANSTWLIGKPLQQDLEKILKIEVAIENDANCLALSEAVDGAGRDYKTVFAIILGTGVGGGLTVNKKLISGPNSITGEWGHNPLPWPNAQELPGPRCYCKRSGCIETFLSGPALEQQYAMIFQSQLKATAIATSTEAQTLMSQFFDRLARSLASVINLIDPNIIVVAGGLNKIEGIYTEVPKLLGRYVFSDSVETPIVKAAHGDSSGVRGAAWL